MARKFKLIKTYPGSPELGIIVEEEKCSSYSIYKATPVVTHSYPANWVENHPEFWDEIVGERAYEILSLICTRDVGALREGDKVYRDGDAYTHISRGRGVIKFPKNCYDKSIWKPFSVKRLSDGEIFSVGDRIDGATYYDRRIISFYFYGDELIVRQEGGKSMLENIKHTKSRLLFTTEDGLDIYEGYTYTCVNTNCWTIFGQTAKENTKLNKGTIAFNDKKLAEEYLWQNKPCLSFNDVQDVLEKASRAVCVDFDKILEKLKNIIQNKN